MAQKKVVIYTDDLTGQESEEISTHTILIDGAGVEIDLSPENHDRLLEILNPYLSADGARRVRGNVSDSSAPRKRSRNSGPGKNEDTAKIRAWAKANGHEVNDRGRVPAAVKEAYEKANG
jgi:hypothetical protein